MEILRSPQPTDRYGPPETIRQRTPWDTPLGDLLKLLLPQSTLSMSSPQDSVTDTMGQRFNRYADQGGEEAMSLGTGASAGFAPVAAPVLFQGRPWIRERIAKLAGPKWGNRWAQDIDAPTNVIARDALADYHSTMGSNPSNIGPEWEVLSKNRPDHWRGERGAQRWEDLVPETWDVVNEILRGQNPPSPWKFSGELKRYEPLRGWEDIDRFLMKEGPELMYPRGATEPQIKGGRFGGGGHIHVSAPEGEEWTPGFLKDLFFEYLKEEPWILPPVPNNKKHAVRGFARNVLEEIKRGHYDNEIRTWKNPRSSYTDTMESLPQKGEAGLNFRADLNPMRPEFRNFYAPEDVGQWGEDILVTQYLLDKARKAKGRFRPKNKDDLINRLYRDEYTPNRQEIRDIHRNRWYPEGIHQEGSPWAGSQVFPPGLAPLDDALSRAEPVTGSLNPQDQSLIRSLRQGLDAGTVATGEAENLLSTLNDIIGPAYRRQAIGR